MVALDEEILLVSSGGVVIRTQAREIASQGRDATGVRVMNLDDGQSVAAVARVNAETERPRLSPGAAGLRRCAATRAARRQLDLPTISDRLIGPQYGCHTIGPVVAHHEVVIGRNPVGAGPDSRCCRPVPPR